MRLGGVGLAIIVLTLVTACKSQGSTADTTTPTTQGTPVAAAPVPEESPANNAVSNSLYAEDFSGEWPVNASYVNLICEKLPSNEQALTATVEGTSYALNEPALATADGGGVQELKAIAKAGADSDQMIALFTQQATALCEGV